jgi:hypothetical protein
MAKSEKVDLFKLHKDEYAATRKPRLVDVKKAVYLSVEGQGAPGGPVFTAKIQALYSIAYTVKMTRKFGGKQDYGVGKLECVWLMEGKESFDKLPPDQWRWKLLIRTPEFVKPAEIAKAAAVLLEKGKLPEVKEVKLEPLAEGLCVQMLHVGPYDKEPETVRVMQAFAESKGLALHGRHHEIYISDPRRIPPERLKTILRHPLKRP